jgi:methylaspartate mutase epsilon subunit
MVQNRRLSEDEFLQQRKEVLSQWPTGKDVNLEEAVEYHRNMHPNRNMVNKLKFAKQHGEIYASTGMGKATLEEQIELYQYVEKEGHADLLGLTPDSITRQNDYKKVEHGWKESIKAGRSMLNGVPVVNIGVAGIRRMVESVNCPIQPRYGAADSRLCDEILLAGGISHTSPDVFMNFWQHHSKVSFDTVAHTHQYVCRLIGYYNERGIPMSASAQGLYGAGIPPSLQTATSIISLLLHAEQGVKYLRIQSAGHGNLEQDTATGRVCLKLLKYYLEIFGYKDIDIFSSVTFNLMQYPVEIGANFAVVFMNTLMAKLIGAQISDIRTVAEAKAIPTKEDIANTFRTAKVIENFLQTQKIGIDEKEVKLEASMQEKEANCILDKVLELGDGDILLGAEKAIQAGVLDNPFAANRAAAGKVMGIKDSEGAIRYLRAGNLPFTKEILDYHKEKIEERERKMGRKIDYETLINDLLAVSRGYLVSCC